MKKKNIKKAKVNIPLTVKTKRNGEEVEERIYANTPHGFKKDDGATTQALGTHRADNRKSIFTGNADGKPAHKSVIVLDNKELFNESKNKSSTTKTTKAVAAKPTATKASPKATGRISSVSKNSVKTPVTDKQNTQKPADSKLPQKSAKKAEATPEKRRVYKSLPKGYSVVQGTVAQKDGTILIHNGKPLFKQNKDGTKQQAKDSHGKSAHKVASLIVDPQAFAQAKNAERQLVDVEIRKHSDDKGGHPHIMVDTVGDKNVSVGITHSKKKGKNHPNIPLEHNPLGGNEQTYLRRQGTVDDKQNYSSIKQTGKLTVTDNDKAKQIGEKAKQKELSKQKSKK